MKKLIILLLIPILFLTGCKDKTNEMFIEQEEKVKEEIKDIKNVTEDKIRESYLFLKNNYDSITKDNKTELVYSAKYIQTIGLKEENDLVKLADLTLIYVKDNNKDNFEALEVAFKNVEQHEDKLITDLYNSYMIDNLVKEVIQRKQEEVIADLKDPSLLTAKNIKNGLNYIEKNIEKPFKNEEVLDNLVYYGLYFSGIKKSSNIKKIGTNTIDYLKTLDLNKLEDVQNGLATLNKDKEIKKALAK